MENADGRDILDQILRQISPAGTEAASPALLSELQAVAQKHAGESLCVDPIAVELVSTSLRSMDIELSDESHSGQMSQWIAASICDDPAARNSLESLWNHLQGKNA